MPPSVRLRHADAEREVLLGRPPVLPELRGCRADAPRTELERDTAVVPVAAQVRQRTVVVPSRERPEISDEHRIAAEHHGMIDQLPGVPAHRAHRETVEAELDPPPRHTVAGVRRAGRRRLRGGAGQHPDGCEERAAVRQRRTHGAKLGKPAVPRQPDPPCRR
jgi:hypothetical protein